MQRAQTQLRSPWLQWLLAKVLPGLRAWPVRDWPAVLARLPDAEFDRIERTGIVAGVVVVTWLLRPAAGEELTLPFAFLTQLLFALPLLLLVVGPFFLRRSRRVLDEAARERTESHSGATRERG
jgi:hypothetical protein